ncbi:MAG TPA: hypothetical protein VEI02_03205 [Planctomycetota bacterium]|nr:hypothetical protein [Planctomycetota bacterium]
MKNIRLRSYKDIGAILTGDGLITPERLKEAADVQQRAGLSVGRALVELGFISEWELARAVAKELGVAFVRLRNIEYRNDAMARIDPALMHHHRFFILETFDGVDTVVVTEPPPVDLLTEISGVLGEKVFFVVSLMSDVERALNLSAPLAAAPADTGGETTAEDILRGFAN